LEIGVLTLTIADASVLMAAQNLNASGVVKYGNVGGSGIYYTVTDIAGAVVAATRRIFNI